MGWEKQCYTKKRIHNVVSGLSYITNTNTVTHCMVGYKMASMKKNVILKNVTFKQYLLKVVKLWILSDWSQDKVRQSLFALLTLWMLGNFLIIDYIVVCFLKPLKSACSLLGMMDEVANRLDPGQPPSNSAAGLRSNLFATSSIIPNKEQADFKGFKKQTTI